MKTFTFILLIVGGGYFNAQVGINTINPQETLHINGSFRLDNSTKGTGKVLTSDINGTGTWQILSSIALTTTGTTGNSTLIGSTLNIPNYTYTLPIASVSVLGGVKTGSGINVAADGTISVPAAANIYNANGTLTSNRTVTQNGNTIAFSTTASLGGVSFISDGTASAPKPVVRVTDGSQGDGKVLTSDASGNATWKNIALPKILGTIVAPTANSTFVVSNQTVRNLGSNITLPPGIWEVEAGILLDAGNARNDSHTWIKFTFTDGGASSTTQSADILGGNKLISGSVITISGTGGDTLSFYGLVAGKVIINNTSAANKTYHLLYWGSVYKGTARTVSGLGSNSYAENYISAIKVQQ